MSGKRKAKQLAVPDIAEDATERKRVLNVLAQRRYRQRRKDRLHTLESRVKSPSGHTVGSTREAPSTLSSSSDTIDALDTFHQTLDSQEGQDPSFLIINGQNEELILPQIPSSDPFLQLVSNTTPQPGIGLSISPNDPFWPQFDFWPDADIQLPFEGSSVDKSSSSGASTDNTNRFDISTALQTSETSSFSFPDDRTLEVPSLALLDAATKVAYRLNLAHLIWDFTAISPFYRPRESSNSTTSLPSLANSSLSPTPNESVTSPNTDTHTPDPTTLPLHLQPTPTQLLIPHHPVFDLLPWPGTRDKFIQVFNLPEQLRPQNARDPMGLMRLIYDMEDIGGEGIKVRSGDPFEPAGWEVGQVMFERWWWAFEVDVLERSNSERKRRGEKVLVLG